MPSRGRREERAKGVAVNDVEIDRAYDQLTQQGRQTADALQALAQKLQTAASAGNTDAREWALDLREIALAIRDEEGQMSTLLQSIHAMVDNHVQDLPQQQVQQAPQYAAQPQYAQPVQYAQPQQSGMLGRFLGSTVGRSIAMGAGFGIGDDIVNDIFR